MLAVQDCISPDSILCHDIWDDYSVYLKLSLDYSIIQHLFFEHQYAKNYDRHQNDDRKMVNDTVTKLQKKKTNVDS